jgi:hypothetical protein
VHKLLVTVNVVPSLPILVTLMMKIIFSSETLVLTRATPCNIPKDGILHRLHRESLNLCIHFTRLILVAQPAYLLLIDVITLQIQMSPLHYDKHRRD